MAMASSEARDVLHRAMLPALHHHIPSKQPENDVHFVVVVNYLLDSYNHYKQKLRHIIVQ